MAKDTIIPVKFDRKLTIKEIEAFSDILVEFEKANNVTVTIISMSAVAKRVNKLKK
jgi:hypothetical protein